ncbi:MAG: hypothetical protein VW929_09575, partial [Actinomycetota bacterium]
YSSKYHATNAASDAADAALSARITTLEADPTTAAAVAAVQADVDQNEADADAALATKAPLASPALTGTPTAPTAAADTNTTQVAERARSFARTDNYTGIGRIYAENPGLGCTGHPGYAPGTVDHAGEPTCPIHEEGRTARLVS